jgi:P pilus assembly chaperone PapD
MLSSRQEIAAGRGNVYWLNIYQIPPNTQAAKRVKKSFCLCVSA